MDKIKTEISEHQTKLTGISREEAITKWKQQSKLAEEEARKLSKRKRPRQRKRLPKKGRSSIRTLKKRTIYRRNRYKHTYTQNIDNHIMHVTNHDIIYPQSHTDHTNHINPAIEKKMKML